MSMVVTQLGRTITQGGNVLGPGGIAIGQAGGGMLGHLFGPDRRYEGMNGGDSQQAETIDQSGYNAQIRSLKKTREELMRQEQGRIKSALDRLTTPGLSFEEKINLAKLKIKDIRSKQKGGESYLDKQIKDKKIAIKQSENEENKYSGEAGAKIDRQIKLELDQHRKDLEQLEAGKAKSNAKQEEHKTIIEEFNKHLQDKKDVHMMDIKIKSKNNPKYDYEKIQDLVNRMNANNISGTEQDRIMEDIQRNGLREYWQYPRFDQRYKLLKPKEVQGDDIQQHENAQQNIENEVQHAPNILNNHEDLNIQEVQANDTNIKNEQRRQEQRHNPNGGGGGGNEPGNPYNPDNQMPNDNKTFGAQVASGILEIADLIRKHNDKDETPAEQLNLPDNITNYYHLQIQNVLNNYSQQQQNLMLGLFDKLETHEVHNMIHLDPEDIMSQYVDYY